MRDHLGLRPGILRRRLDLHMSCFGGMTTGLLEALIPTLSKPDPTTLKLERNNRHRDI